MQWNPARPPSAGASRIGTWRAVTLGVAVVGALVSTHLLDLGARLGELRSSIDGLGAWGPWAFLALYVVAVVAAVPGSAITVAAGALFGSPMGLLLVSVGSTVGASLAFLIARYAARAPVQHWLGDNPHFRRLDALAERHGALMVAVTRLVPLFPFNLVNYGFGLTRVPFRTYVFWTWLAMLPLSAVYVVGADAVTAALRDGRLPWPLLVALAGLVPLAAGFGYLARRRLRDDPHTEPADR